MTREGTSIVPVMDMNNRIMAMAMVTAECGSCGLSYFLL